VDGIWLLGSTPLSLCFVTLAALRRRPVALGVREDLLRYASWHHRLHDLRSSSAMRRLERRDVLPLLAGLPTLAIFAWWMADEGGYAPADWIPGLVGVAAVLGMVVALAPARGRRSRPAVVAIAAFSAYALWSLASILWADAPGPALEGSQRTLLYLVCFTSLALAPWTPRALLVFVILVVSTITVVGLVTLLRVAGAADPLRFFFEARLLGPLGYQNASAALWTMGAVPALVLAARPEVVAWLRPLLLGAAGLLLGLTVTTQSRGWLFTLPIVLLAALVLVRGRARSIVFAAPVAVALALISGDLVEPYRAAVDVAPAEAGPVLRLAFDGVARSLLIATGALVVAGGLMVWIETLLGRRFDPSRAVRRGFTAALLGMLAVGCVAGAAVATDGDPLQRIEGAWTDKNRELRNDNRFDELDSPRYALWQDALDLWREHPLVGLGQDNFAQAYITERTSGTDEPRWTHSLPLRLLVHTGLVGAVLFGLFVIAAAWAVIAGWSRRAGGGHARLAGSVALLPAVVWLVHGSVDWLWEYPALSGPALALAGAATALGSEASHEDRAPPPPRPPRRRVAAACVMGLGCAALALPSYVADRDVRNASARWPADPEGAFDALARARALNPLNARASLVEGLIAVQLGRLGRARVGFTRAAKREPQDWFARFELGLVAGARRDRRTALEQLLVARRLNPRDPLVAQAVVLARRGRTMSFETAQHEFEIRVQRRVSARLHGAAAGPDFDPRTGQG